LLYKYWSNDGIDTLVTPPWFMFNLNPVVGDTGSFEGDLGPIYAGVICSGKEVIGLEKSQILP